MICARLLGRLLGRLLAFAALLGLAACGAGPCGLSPLAVVPVQITAGIPLVTIGVNGQPATMILDTGAQSFLLSPSAVLRLGLATDKSAMVAVSGTGGQSRRWAAVMQRIRLGEFNLPDTYAVVLPTELPAAGGRRIDGLMGIGVLNRYEIDLDLPASRVTLHQGPACPGGPPGFTKSAKEFANLAREGGRYVIPLRLDNQVLEALIDTGAQTTTVGHAAAARGGITDAMLAADPLMTLIGVGPDQVPARRHRFREISVGDETMADPVLTVMPAYQASPDAILGFDYLAQRRLWLSPARRMVFIAAPG